MKQREVQDSNNVKWQCVEAFSGGSKEMHRKASMISKNEEGEVEVVCTPSGGAQTVRLQLQPNWIQSLTDEQLLAEIIKAGNGSH
jgi:hypothetical protein